MTLTFSEKLFCAGVPESKKLELIYRTAATLPPEDLKDAATRLRADWRYARLLGALINASRSTKLAIEELFLGNAVTPKIVSGFKWLYVIENKGFISEDFVGNTLPGASSSCQKQIVNKISKWVTNTELGNVLWEIVRTRSVELASMLLGACSNELIIREVKRNNRCLSLPQMLDILRKRFDSGLELIRTIAAADKLNDSPINKPELYRVILKRDFKKGTELLSFIKKKVSHGRHLTRRLIKLVSAKEVDLSALLNLIKNVKQRVLARHASSGVYIECFLEHFDRKEDFCNDNAMLGWLKHLRDEAKLEAIETWCQKRRGSALVHNFATIPESFLFLLDEKTLKRVVSQRIVLGSGSDDSDDYLLYWQSMLPDDEESFAKQKQRLKGESSAFVRKNIYLNMLKSVTVLKRPQYLERRLKFVVERMRNDYESQAAIVELLFRTLRDEYKFTFTEEIWPHVRELIQLRLLLRKSNDARIERVYKDILMLGLEQVSFDRQDFLATIMEEIMRVLGLNRNLHTATSVLSKEKRQYFWNRYLAYIESHEDTKRAEYGKVSSKDLQSFYLALAERGEDTRNLLQGYPKTFRILNRIVNMNARHNEFRECDLFQIYNLLKPLLPSDEPFSAEIVRLRMAEEEETRKRKALKAFAKSNIMTEEVRLHYLNNRDKNFARLCGRSLLHAEVEKYSKWISMLEQAIEKGVYSTEAYRHLNLKAMISSTEKLRCEVESLYPPEDPNKETGYEMKGKRFGTARSLRYFGESYIAVEWIMHFMKGDYLKYALPAFNHHMSRLPNLKVVAYLMRRILNKNSPVSARKAVLQGFFANILIGDKTVVRGVVEQLSKKDEHDNIKNEVLLAIYKIIEKEGEVECWPLMKICLDSIGVEDRTCFTTTLVSKASIDVHIPSNIEYLMRKLLEMSESETYVKEYKDIVLQRIGENLERLSPAFLFALFEKIKSSSWSNGVPRSLAIGILLRCLPEHTEALRSHFMTFGHTNILDPTNSAALTRDITERFLNKKVGNAVEVLDFLAEVFEKRASDDLLEQRLLELTKIILPLMPEGREEEDLRPSLREVTLAALRATAGFIDKFGTDLQEFLIDDLLRTLATAFPHLSRNKEWTEDLLDVYHEGLGRRETMIFLRILSSCYFDERGKEKSRELFLQHEDRFVRIAFKKLCM